MKFIIATAALLIVGAQAACPNSCSGHGSCNDNEVCLCHDNFGMGGQNGGDCSDRMCPYELAWVDSPAKDGSTHNYAECAAKGICDRSTGLCECFEGYEGKGCGRQVCKDDCSGHGTCQYMDELTFGTVYNDYYDGLDVVVRGFTNGYTGVGVGGVRPMTDLNWDASRARACVCDSGYTGLSCTQRMCPVGNDVLDTRANTAIAAVDQVQQIALFSGGLDGQGNFTATIDQDSNDNGVINEAGAGGDAVRRWAGGVWNHHRAGAVDFVGKTFALRFTSKLNETYTTQPIEFIDANSDTNVDAGDFTDLDAKVEAALLKLPNKVINGVTVTTQEHLGEETYSTGRGIVMAITFTGTSVEGNQNLIEVISNPCTAKGCSPMVDGLGLSSVSFMNNQTLSFVTQKDSADYNSYECGRRGKCDTETGICDCFEGYTSEACTTMSSLV